MRVYKNLLLVLSMLVVSFAQGQDASYSISEAEEYGVQNNERVKNSLLDVEAARKKVWETTAIGLPQVNAEASFQNMLDIPTSVVDASLFNPDAQPGEVTTFQMGQSFTTGLTFNATQLVFDGSYIVGLRFVKFYTKMSKTALNNTEIQVKEMVREAYYNVLIADRNLEHLDSILASTELLWNKTKLLHSSGVMPIEEVNQIEIAYNRVLASEQNAIRQSVIARNLLKLQMGMDLDKEILLTETLDGVIDSIRLFAETMDGLDVKNNANYIMLTDQQILDGFNLQNEKASYLPSVGAFFSHSQNAYRDDANIFANEPWYPTTVWGVSVKVPITSSGQKIARVQQAEIKLEQGSNDIELAERTLKYQEFQLKATFQTALELMEIESNNVILANSIYVNAIKKEGVGVYSSLEVTQLQQQLLDAQGSYILSVFALLNAKIQLDKLYNQ